MDPCVSSDDCVDDDEYSTCLIIECGQECPSRRGVPSRR